MVTTRSPILAPQSEPTPQSPQIGFLSRPLENFKEAVIRVAAERLQRPITEAEVVRIKEDIAEKKHILSRTPDHPPYAAMIRTALLELNEEGGSSEMSISNFIKKENPGLPFAHSAYLKHFLDKLCNSKEIAVNSENRYVLVDHNASSPVSLESDNPKELRERRGRPRRRDQTRKGKKGKENLDTSGLRSVVQGEQNETTEEHNQQIEKWFDAIEEEKSGAVVNGTHEHKRMRIKFRVSKNEPTMETVVSDVPLAVVDYENVGKIKKKKLKPAYGDEKPEEASTTALILDLVHSNSQPQEQVRRKKLGRPRKIKSSGEEGDMQKEQLPKRRGRPRKMDKVQKQQPPRRRGRPRKEDMCIGGE